jgi:predicted XRE-type DNA-binding protein
MGRNINQVVAELPADSQARINRRFTELKTQIESLAELRKMSGKVQADIATTLKIKQPSVSKLEKQADMYLSTLRDYVRALGGELDLVVRMPRRPAMHLRHFGDAFSLEKANPPIAKRVATAGRRAAKAR